MASISNNKLICIIVLSIIAVLSHWNFWYYVSFSIGINTALCGIALWCLLLSLKERQLIKRDIIWLAPLWMVLLSFALYESTWLKLISIFLILPATGFIYVYRQTSNCDQMYWNNAFIYKLFCAALSPLKYLSEAIKTIMNRLNLMFKKTENNLFKRIGLGLVILLPIGIVILVLLTSADANFLSFVTEILSIVMFDIKISMPIKFIFICLVSAVILSSVTQWNIGVDHSQEAMPENKKLDSVIAGIVMIGVITIYVAFLYFQIEYIAINNLPADFSLAEKIVKSGFWQLFFLSILNAVMFFVLYKNTENTVQVLLRVFILASGLVLLSACWRMGLYVYWYGLSYEKFFASYTALFALAVFVFLVIASFASLRKDIFKFIIISSLWFYATATLLPIEKIIFHSNIKLAQQLNSKVDLYHLTDLSVDILSDVEAQLELGTLNSERWQYWLQHLHNFQCGRLWYENSVSSLVNCKGIESEVDYKIYNPWHY